MGKSNNLSFLKDININKCFFDNSKYTVFYIHGVAGDCKSFKRISQKLEENQISYFTLDLPCHGLSKDIPFSKINIRELANIVVQVIQHYQLRDIILFGHSMGGGIACLIYKKIKDLVKKVILVDPINITLMSKFFNAFTLGFATLFKNENLINKYQFFNVNKCSQEISNIDWIDFVKNPHDVLYKKKFIFFILTASFSNFPLLSKITKMYKEISCPLYLIMGKEDKMVDAQKTLKWAKKNNNKVQEIVIENSGHVPFIEQFSTFIEKFINIIKK